MNGNNTFATKVQETCLQFRQAAELNGWTKNQIDEVIREAISKRYDHFVDTIQKYCE